MTMKGGTGKTTTAISVSHALALCGKKVLLIDCDPQGGIAATFGVNGEQGLAQLLISGSVDIIQVRDNLFIIDSGGRKLAEAELLLGRKQRREQRLREALRYLKNCDYVICDCSPSVNLININALVYCEDVIVPVAMDHLSERGAEQTMEMIEEVGELLGNSSFSYRILPTFCDARTRISRFVLERIRQRFGELVFDTVIRVNSTLGEAPGSNKTIFEHAPLSRGAYDYYRLTEEILGAEDGSDAAARGMRGESPI